jgi:hypothetical protein
MAKRDEKVQLKCIKCNIQFEISRRTIQKRISNSISLDICTKCLIGDISKNNWKHINDDDRSIMIEKIRNKTIQQWEKYSEEQRKLVGDRISIQQKNYWSNVNIEEKTKRLNKLWNGSKQYWMSLSEDDKKKHIEQLRYFNKQYWDDMTDDERIDRYFKISSSIANSDKIEPFKTEFEFMKALNLYHIDYKHHYCNSIIHNNFYDHFDKFSNPFHVWDFIIYTKQSNILIDIDGSIHTIPPGEYVTKNDGIDVGASIQNNDSKRPYQTDEYDSYIIEAYDDNLNDDTPVLQLGDCKYITYRQLWDIIQFNNMSKNEIKMAL